MRAAQPVMEEVLADLLSGVDPDTLSEATAMMERIEHTARTANERTSA
jgi:hypothetical protein